MKQTVSPLQAEEVNNLRRKLANFDVRQHTFRESFRTRAPFSFSSTHPYVRINRVRLQGRQEAVKNYGMCVGGRVETHSSS